MLTIIQCPAYLNNYLAFLFIIGVLKRLPVLVQWE